jgi:teichoic acid transport system permease protein
VTETLTTAEDQPQLRPYSDVEYVFEPHSSTLPAVRAYLQDAWDRRHFVAAMAKADLRGPRSRTGLGELWAIADPLFQAGIYWFLLSTIRSTGGDNTERLTILVSGIFLFTFSSTVLSGGGRSIIRNKGLMLNSTFPRILLPATEVYKGLLDLGPYLAVYVVIHLLLGGPVGPGIFVLPLLIVLQVMISSGLALIFATLTVFISDMSNLLDYVMRVLFFTTPILYPVSELPPLAVTLLKINPFFTLFACYQKVVTGGLPNPTDLLQSVVWAVLLCVVGFRVFVTHERGFALRL